MEALTWLQTNWGTLKPLRHVSVRALQDRRARRHGKITYEFWSADWTPGRLLSVYDPNGANSFSTSVPIMI